MSNSKTKIVHQYRKLLKNNFSLEEIDRDVFENFHKKWLKKRQKKRIGYSFFLLSALCFIFVLLPIFSVFIKQAFSNNGFFNPLPESEVLQFSSYQNNDYGFDALPVRGEVTVIDEQLNYSNLSNWFSEVETSIITLKDKNQSEYILEIPKLNIFKAKVAVNDENLSKSLVQYQGTPSPGGFGAPIIFGHSSLRQFYNPDIENKSRYSSLFSTIMTLEKNDKIFLIKNGVCYTYRVTFKENVKPDDRYILSQRYDLKYLKLVTCTPEGTFLMRGIVSAQLIGSRAE
jgi:LPXTG-site transpeptidase (sortase) family protein